MFYIYIDNFTCTLIKIKLNFAVLLFCALYYTTLKPIHSDNIHIYKNIPKKG